MTKKLAIVTGGTRGIGKAISIMLDKAGYEVIANYGHNDQSAMQFEQETGIKAQKWDVSNFDECAKNIQEIETIYRQSVAVLVNNAGITKDSMMHKMDSVAWGEVINTNLNSCFHMCRAVINSMRNAGFGRIVNISSINGLAGMVGQTNYSAAKAGVMGFTKALAKESASKGITVNAIAPGYIKTDMTDMVPQAVIEKITEQIPVKRLGNPDEIARAVIFLVADDAGFVTGETISINGGHYMH
jgi:acetoacetyl-CoA reductase